MANANYTVESLTVDGRIIRREFQSVKMARFYAKQCGRMYWTTHIIGPDGENVNRVDIQGR